MSYWKIPFRQLKYRYVKRQYTILAGLKEAGQENQWGHMRLYTVCFIGVATLGRKHDQDMKSRIQSKRIQSKSKSNMSTVSTTEV